MSTAYELDPDMRGPDRPELSIVDSGATEGPFFSSDLGVVSPNYDLLVERAEHTDPAALIVTIMQEVRLVESDENLLDAKPRLSQLEEEIAPLAEKDENAPEQLSDGDVLRHYSLEQEAKSIQESLERYMNTIDQISKAYRLTKENYQPGDSRLDELHTETQAFESSTLLEIIQELQRRLPKPREGSQAYKYAHTAVKEAERTLRLLILQEVTQHS